MSKFLGLILLLAAAPSAFAANATSFVISCAQQVDKDQNITGTPERICIKVKSAADVAAVISCAEKATANGLDIGICSEVTVP